jgi:CRISPR/Cas system-associated exonuclease Cas4 (RecB family)
MGDGDRLTIWYYKNAISQPQLAMTAISAITSISQGHLNIWETCRRKYQHKYLEELSLPETNSNQEKLRLGSNFHLLMQQKELGLDVVALASSDPALQKWLAAFENQPPVMLDGDRLCEHRRILEITSEISLHNSGNSDRGQGDFLSTTLITVIYDFLILGDLQGQILDWKTHQVPIKQDVLQDSWQTRLYLYVLAKTTNYAPSQLSMTYWFANTGDSVIIPYSQVEYDRTEIKLQQILHEMAEAEEYPQLNLEVSSACKHCEFRERCDRGDLSADISFSDIEDIPEITI